jgi:hypothetical protein
MSAEALDARLPSLLPSSAQWHRTSAPGAPGCTYVATSPSRSPARGLEVRLRDDGDVDVCFVLEGVSGSPFEQHFTVHDAAVEEAAIAIAAFVLEILAERRVLMMDKRFLRGGRKFLSPQQIEMLPPRRIAWVASWNGTFDRRLGSRA